MIFGPRKQKPSVIVENGVFIEIVFCHMIPSDTRVIKLEGKKKKKVF